MVELFEQDVKTIDRQSSKGNQIKWLKGDIWYKADYTGYEGLAEYVISHLLLHSGLKENEFIIYTPETIKYKSQIFNGVSSKNFLHDDWKIITIERLYKACTGKSLNETLWKIPDVKERLAHLVDSIEYITRLKGFGEYINKIFTIDALFLNEDRHTHNIAVLTNDNGDYAYSPIFDNGAGLLADTKMDYPMNEDVYRLIKSVKARTISKSLDEQLAVSEKLYGINLKFNFNRTDVEKVLSNGDIALMYGEETIDRVTTIICEQMRKYNYLFK